MPRFDPHSHGATAHTRVTAIPATGHVHPTRVPAANVCTHHAPADACIHATAVPAASHIHPTRVRAVNPCAGSGLHTASHCDTDANRHAHTNRHTDTPGRG